MASTKSLCDRLRAALRAEAGECPTCGHLNRSGRELAKTLDVPSATLWRFMAGKAPSAALIDKLYRRYLEKEARRG